MGDSAMFEKMLKKKIDNEPFLRDVVEIYNPDVILIDDFFGLPSLIYSNIPWVSICSGNPLGYFPDERLPPAGSGEFDI